MTCVIGGNQFRVSSPPADEIVSLVPISVDDADLIRFDIHPDGNLYVNATLLDDCNLPLLGIKENQLAFRTEAWDIKFAANTLTVRETAKEIFFEVTFEPPDRIEVSRARLLCNGVEVLVRESHVYVANTRSLYVQNKVIGPWIGIQIGRNERKAAAAICANSSAVSRYFMPRAEVEAEEREALNRLLSMDNSIFARYPLRRDDNSP